MEVSGEVADLMLKEGLEAAKIATELSAKGLVNVAALLAAMVKQHYKVVGKVGIERLMKDSNAESVIIPIKAADYLYTQSPNAFAHSDILVHLIPIVQYWFPCRNLSELRFYRKDNCGLWHRIIPQPICFIMKRIMTNDSKNGKIASARVWRVLNDYER